MAEQPRFMVVIGASAGGLNALAEIGTGTAHRAGCRVFGRIPFEAY
ncbi:hypothetical protein [Dyadobacter sp. CY312]|nr:hypothetical protein [Dyadobacter sp. CY312]MCE7042889.1 hypothetical protein [Dyadobacter sp. CY312]